ncbi:putative acetylglutamate synthase protein [Neofusicoccum parvum UCRNP2]|uniref:Amino-acid acetyltransferase, mitochondrial n=1 Tax=Botryosphaeria parva (strain UCR-NP2) TaxID=1287680 RepID=R1GMZ0_BOTPV|nr:putative acetylglutamate synthase protein [Neofusicoccum parvum UCRNP2]
MPQLLLSLFARGSAFFVPSAAIDRPAPVQRCRQPVASFGNSVRPDPRDDDIQTSHTTIDPDHVDHEREFILNVLSTTATKRDARAYLARYQPQSRKKQARRIAKRYEQVERSSAADIEKHNGWRLKQTGVNLGSLYTPSKAMLESPVFTHQELPEEMIPEEEVVQPLHVALVKIRAVELWDAATLYGVSLTLGQLVRLGLSIAVVVDCDEEAVPDAPEKLTKEWRDKANDQADRIVESLRRTTPQGAVRINDALTISEFEQEVPSKVDVRGGVDVEYPNLLLPLLQGGKIPVIPPIAFTKGDFKVNRVRPDDVMLALTREFSGIRNVANRKDIPLSRDDSPLAEIPSIMPATFVKRGMPVTMIPNPNLEPWRPPQPGESTFDLSDPRIDFPRLLNLIEDSFGRKLDVEHYLNRIKNKLAGVIIAGEYEGGAILTWEYPPDDIGPNGERIPRPPVPYLDKFAVLKRSQGSGGVADVVFKAMVRTCFPDGVVWRSRRDNPVNKWYFERSTGTLKLDAWDGSKWTMFWTTEDVERDEGLWKDYQKR